MFDGKSQKLIAVLFIVELRPLISEPETIEMEERPTTGTWAFYHVDRRISKYNVVSVGQMFFTD